MISLYEFIKAEAEQAPLLLDGPQSANLQLPLYGEIERGVSGMLESSGALSSNEAKRFGKQVAELVASDDFLKVLSGQIQQPHPGETRGAFVQRCSEEMAALIKSKLKAK